MPTKKKAKPTPPKGPPPEETAALVADDETVYTLPDLVRRLGEATEAEVAIFVDVTDPGLVDEGRGVATPRIDTDTARLYGQAVDFFAGATPTQKRLLLTVSIELLRVAAWAALWGSQCYEAANAGRTGESIAREARIVNAAKVSTLAHARRNQLAIALRALTRNDKTWRARITGAYGTAAETKDLAKALTDLVTVGRAILADKSSVIVDRRKHSSLDAAWLDEAQTLAAEVLTLGGKAKAALPAGPVSHAEVDRRDGINLALLEQLIDAFEAGHAEDPAIPRLIPKALRNYFSRTRRAPAPAPEPAPPA